CPHPSPPPQAGEGAVAGRTVWGAGARPAPHAAATPLLPACVGGRRRRRCEPPPPACGGRPGGGGIRSRRRRAAPTPTLPRKRGRERPGVATLPAGGAGFPSPGARQASGGGGETFRPRSCREGGRPAPGRSRRAFDMRIKRFTAPDMRTALRMVREEQGPDAVILSTRPGAGGAGIEVVAATDYDEALVTQALRAAAPGLEDAGAQAGTVPERAASGAPTSTTPTAHAPASAARRDGVRESLL